MPDFIPGRVLAAAFYAEAVAPLIRDVPHDAALLGYGSDVLGFDTERSTDHGWGPRVTLLVRDEDVVRARDAVDHGLPPAFRGFPTTYGWDEVTPRHHVRVATVDEWVVSSLGFDPRAEPTVVDWLTTPQQLLLEATAGPAFHDGLGELARVRAALAWYPHDVWLWLLACQWRRIGQEEPFVGRAAEVGDELGSRVLAARLAREAMRLAFLLERRYAPYSKWLGTAFARLDAAAELAPPLGALLAAPNFAEREPAWIALVEALARRHTALGVTASIDPTVRPFHSRPSRVIGAERFTRACLERIADARVRELPLIGAVDQFVDSTDALESAGRARLSHAFYAPTT